MPEFQQGTPAAAAKKKTLVVGGGTGATAAYLLSQVNNFDVMLVEKEPALGGHIKSKRYTKEEIQAKLGSKEKFKMAKDASGNKVGVVELGAEFVGPPEAYPLMHILFAHLGIPLEKFMMSAHLNPTGSNNGISDNSIVVPPAYFVTHGGNCSLLDCFLSCCTDYDNQGQLRVSWDSLLSSADLGILLYFQLALWEYYQEIQANPAEAIFTLEDFVKKFEADYWFLPNVEKVGLEFVYPICAGQWGVPVDDAKQYMAHYALNYLALGMDWYDCPVGLDSYIQELQRRMAGKVDIRTGTAVDCIEQIAEVNPAQYRARLKDGSYLKDALGQIAIFDDVVLATDANVTKELVREMSQYRQEVAYGKNTLQVLDDVKSFATHLAFHVDPRFETPQHTIVNTRMEQGRALNTAAKLWKCPIKKTWMRAAPGQDPLDPNPSKVLDHQYWQHPHMKYPYYLAERVLKGHNRRLRERREAAGVHFAGCMEGGGDSHNDGLESAMQAVIDLQNKYGVALLSNAALGNFLEPTANGLQLKRKNSQLPDQLQDALERRDNIRGTVVAATRTAAKAANMRTRGLPMMAAQLQRDQAAAVFATTRSQPAVAAATTASIAKPAQPEEVKAVCEQVRAVMKIKPPHVEVVGERRRGGVPGNRQQRCG